MPVATTKPVSGSRRNGSGRGKFIDEASMEPEGGLRNTRMREMRAEVVIKEDGRYLIYYSWPADPGHPPDGTHAGRTKAAPDQQPWSPETDPSPEIKTSDV